MILPGREGWRTNDIELCWYRCEIGYHTGFWHEARGLVWARGSLSLVASVLVKNHEYSISTSGLHGLTDAERGSLARHLQSLGLAEAECRRHPKQSTGSG